MPETPGALTSRPGASDLSVPVTSACPPPCDGPSALTAPLPCHRALGHLVPDRGALACPGCTPGILSASFFPHEFHKTKIRFLAPWAIQNSRTGMGAISNVGFWLTCSQANGPEDGFSNCLDNHQNSNSETNFSKRDVSEKQLTCIWWSRGPVSSFIMPDMSLAIRWLHCSPKYCPREFHWFSWTRLRQQRHLFTFF